MNITSEQAWVGLIKSADSARQLFASAKILAESKSYGHATALMVLSAEESAKAIALLGVYVGDSDSEENIVEFFKYHKTKQKFASFTFLLISFMRCFMDEVNRVKNDPSIENGQQAREFFKRSCDTARKWVSEPPDSIRVFEGWRDLADDLKKRGFYVDYIEGGWVCPSAISVEDFELTSKMAMELINVLNVFTAVEDPVELQKDLKANLNEFKRISEGKRGQATFSNNSS